MLPKHTYYLVLISLKVLKQKKDIREKKRLILHNIRRYIEYSFGATLSSDTKNGKTAMVRYRCWTEYFKRTPDKEILNDFIKEKEKYTQRTKVKNYKI